MARVSRPRTGLVVLLDCLVGVLGAAGLDSVCCPFGDGAVADPPVLLPLKALDFARAREAATACIAAPSTDLPINLGRRIIVGLAILRTGAGRRGPLSRSFWLATDAGSKGSGSDAALDSAFAKRRGATLSPREPEPDLSIEPILGFSSFASVFGDSS